MDLTRVEELIRIVKDARVSELTLREGDSLITIKKPAVAAVPAAPPARTAPERAEKAGAPEEAPAAVAVTAPMVGIYHAAAELVQVGSVIAAGQSVGAIESMKLMNDVRAGVGGRVTEVLIDDGQPVEYGQILFRLAPLEAQA